MPSVAFDPKLQPEPWHRRSLRWGQTNLVEIDPDRYDADWWRAHWRRTRIQGVIVNAGGIVAYYPSEIPLHNRALKLEGRDLFGQITADARQEGLTVVARMDSSRVAEEFYKAHREWICVDAEGRPYQRGDRYVTCINSPYYRDYLPRVMEEIVRRASPDGFADNSWAGLPRGEICHCASCREDFFTKTGFNIPLRADWDDEAYQAWIRWSYERRTDLWRHNNAVTRAAGGPHCHWFGMLHGDILETCERFVDLPAILAESELVLLDHQRRNAVDGFEQNTEVGKRFHGLLGWDRLIPESTPQYQLGTPAYRLASMPAAEVRLWSSSGFAGGIQPWWHHIGALHEDRRQYQTAEPIFAWHEANEDVLVDREPLADVGLVWSQLNHDFFGRDQAEDRTVQPYRGAMRALDRAGLTYLPIHADKLECLPDSIRVLVLPNLGAMSDAQCAAVEQFAARGGGVVATSDTGGYDANGATRSIPGLADLLGTTRVDNGVGSTGRRASSIEISAGHSYLRLEPGLRHLHYGPRDASVGVQEQSGRHPVLEGFDGTDILPFGGYLPRFEVAADAQVLSTYIPDFPIYPPETAWMREPVTDIPAIVTRQTQHGARIVHFLSDVDRCFARDGQFEHGLLLANAIRWAIGDRPRVGIEGGKGLLSVTLYAQPRRQIMHLNNRLVVARVPGRQDVIVPLERIQVRLKLETIATHLPRVELRVAGKAAQARIDGDELIFDIEKVEDHEVAVIEFVT